MRQIRDAHNTNSQKINWKLFLARLVDFASTWQTDSLSLYHLTANLCCTPILKTALFETSILRTVK